MLYQVREDREVYERGYTGEVHARHNWVLPGVMCPVCGATWAMTGSEYPAVDLTAFIAEEEYRITRAVPLAEFRRLREQIAEFVPRRCELVPGTGFGRLVGKTWGHLPDLIWMVPWTLIMRTDAADRLAERGVRFPPMVQPDLTFRGKTYVDLVDLQLEPGPFLADLGNGDAACPACGWKRIEYPDPIVIDGGSVPTDVDLFRVSNFPTILLCTERFAEAVHSLGLLGARFEEVEVVL